MPRFGPRAMSASFVAGLLFFLAASAPAPSEGATIYTRSASCAGLSFYPTDSRTEYDNYGTLRVHRTGDNPFGTGVFRCDPGLPNGAVVKKVQFTVGLRDNSGLVGVGQCALRRSSLAPATATQVQDLARVTPAVTGPTGTYRLTDSTITNATIDNSLYGYWLECEHVESWQWTATVPLTGLYGADVIYTISSTKG